MSVYYNEFEPYAAEWLRNLIKAGHIPDGEVDTRSIVDVEPADLRGFSQCHFFSGIGGWSHALRLAGWADDREIWTGSCPCQPFSVAGKGAGTDDPRHLWPHFFRLIRSCRPAVVMGEQVAGKAGYGWFDGVRSDLEGEGYASRAVDIPACAVNAPHIRQRLYWVADANGELHDGRGDFGARRRNEYSNGGSSGDMAHAERIGRRGRPHDEDEGRREQPFADPCEGSGDVADAYSQRSQGQRPDSDTSGRRRSDVAASGLCDGTGNGDVANANGRDAISEGLQRSGLNGLQSEDRRDRRHSGNNEWATFWSHAEWATGADGKTRRVKSGILLLVNGVSGGVAYVRTKEDGTEEKNIYSRVGALRAFGNAIVPPLAAEVIRAFMETHDHG